MRQIKELVEEIKEELDGAENYAIKFVEAKAREDALETERLREMTLDELKHASWIHNKAVQEIQKISQTYTPPPEMIEKWKHEHKEYVERAAHIRQMLEV